MPTSSNSGWHYFAMGDWIGPFRFSTVKKYTRRNSCPFLMAGGVNDEQLDEVRRLPKTAGLAIISPLISASATATIQRLPKLRELILCGLSITDAFLERLSAQTTLQSITLVHTACTEDGVRRFLNSAPQCNIYRGDEHSIFPAFDRRELLPFLGETSD